MLSSPSRPRRRVSLRELVGHDELLPDGTGPAAGSALLGRMGLPADAGPLTLAERDRLLAEIYRAYYGDTVEANARCPACGGVFELAFSLEALLRDLDGRAAAAPEADLSGPDAAGVYTLGERCRFRVPTTDDERAIATLGQEPEEATRALLERCVVEGDPIAHAAAIEQAMEALAPVIDLALPARCALCRAEQRVPFDMVSFFFSTLARERPLLHREVHCLAVTYHWGHDEILRLPRGERRAYAALVLAAQRASGAESWIGEE